MTGTLAETIQGEAGSNPANQFAVASAIYNRQQAGTFPGGANLNNIVNAPSQFTGFSATPNSSAQQFATALQNGTLSNYGSVGNATYFQSGQTAVNNGLTSGGANIGGNYFSDTLGPPTSGFQAPVYGAASGGGSTTTLFQPDYTTVGDVVSGGTDPVTGQPDWQLPEVNVGSGDVYGTSPTGTASATGSSTPGTSLTAGTGSNVNVGLQPSTVADIGSWIQAPITAAENAMSGWLASLENWFGRGMLILLGIAILLVALWKISGSPSPAVIMEAA